MFHEFRQSLPFLTRRMLAFDHEATFELTGEIRSSSDRLVKISGFTREGPFVFQIQTGAGLTGNAISFRIPDVPIAVIVSDDSAAATQNSVYVELNLGIQGTTSMNLCKGHLGPNHSIGWPHSPQLAPMQNRGEIVVLTTADPAAGAEISFTTEAQSWLLLKSFFVTLATDATVANRRPSLQFTINGTLGLVLLSATNTTAGQSKVVSFVEGIQATADTISVAQSDKLANNLLLPPGTIIATVTTNLQLADNYTAATLLAERFQSN